MQALSFSASLGQRVTVKAAAPARAPVAASAPVAKQVLEGTVVSTGGSKTAVVLVSRKVPHPRYIKLINKSNKFAAHDENEEAEVGDVVRIEACRPMSKTKKFTLQKVVRSKAALIAAKLAGK